MTPVLRDDAVLTGTQICFLGGYFIISHNKTSNVRVT